MHTCLFCGAEGAPLAMEDLGAGEEWQCGECNTWHHLGPSSVAVPLSPEVSLERPERRSARAYVLAGESPQIVTEAMSW